MTIQQFRIAVREIGQKRRRELGELAQVIAVATNAAFTGKTENLNDLLTSLMASPQQRGLDPMLSDMGFGHD